MENLGNKITAINGLRALGEGTLGDEIITAKLVSHEEVDAIVDEIIRPQTLLEWLKFIIEKIQQSVKGNRKKQ